MPTGAANLQWVSKTSPNWFMPCRRKIDGSSPTMKLSFRRRSAATEASISCRNLAAGIVVRKARVWMDSDLAELGLGIES